jgi:bacterioferritin
VTGTVLPKYTIHPIYLDSFFWHHSAQLRNLVEIIGGHASEIFIERPHRHPTDQRRLIMEKASKEKRRQHVIDALNQARGMELLAISQYMNQHYNLDNLDYGELAAKIKLIAIDEMRHAEKFAERIKELTGEPVANFDGKVVKGQKVDVIYSFDANLEDNTIDVYNQLVLTCRDNGDSSSMKLFQQIIDEEQIHYNYFDNVNDHIKTLGDTYLAKIAGTSSATGLGPSGFVLSEQGPSTPG